MLTIDLKDAKAHFSSLVAGVLKSEFVTITRHGKPATALVSIEVAETFPGGAVERNRAPSRDFEL